MKTLLPIALALLSFSCGGVGASSAQCPGGPQAPLGTACATPGLSCDYGYTPAVCGGRTVQCTGGVWVETLHSDPQPGCYDAGPAAACPGSWAPLGEACASAGLTCAYGYFPAVCGGRTVQCTGGVWVELEHTDPQPGCLGGDAGR
jgi:hypothetical protein